MQLGSSPNSPRGAVFSNSFMLIRVLVVRFTHTRSGGNHCIVQMQQCAAVASYSRTIIFPKGTKLPGCKETLATLLWVGRKCVVWSFRPFEGITKHKGAINEKVRSLHLEKLRRILSMHTNSSEDVLGKTESDSPQQCPATGQEAMGTNWNSKNSTYMQLNTFSLWGLSNTGSGCP